MIFKTLIELFFIVTSIKELLQSKEESMDKNRSLGRGKIILGMAILTLVTFVYWKLGPAFPLILWGLYALLAALSLWMVIDIDAYEAFFDDIPLWLDKGLTLAFTLYFGYNLYTRFAFLF